MTDEHATLVPTTSSSVERLPAIVNDEDSLRIPFDVIYPHIKHGKSLNPRLMDPLDQLLSSNKLVGFGVVPNGNNHRLLAIGASANVKLELLHLLFPVYFSEHVLHPSINNLSPPIIPYEVMFPYFRSNQVEGLLQQRGYTSAHAECARGIVGVQHTRFIIAHEDHHMVASWMWEVLGCLEFWQADKIVAHEETGEVIANPAAATKGTVAGWLVNPHGVSCILTAKHVAPNNYTVNQRAVGGGAGVLTAHINNGVVADWYDSAVFSVVMAPGQQGSNQLTIPGSPAIQLGHASPITPPFPTVIFKYGSVTGRLITMATVAFIFNGIVEKPSPTRVIDYVIGEGNVGDSAGGDSGGPWWYNNGGNHLVFATHNATISIPNNNPPPGLALQMVEEEVLIIYIYSGREYFGGTHCEDLIDNLIDEGYTWS